MSVSNPPGNPESELEFAHLLMLRGEYREARKLLADLGRRFPGNADVEHLLAKVIELEAQQAPRRRIDFSVLTRTMSPQFGIAILVGLGFTFFGLLIGVPAILAAAANGVGGIMAVEGKLRMHTVPIASQLTRALVFMMIGTAFFLRAYWLSHRK